MNLILVSLEDEFEVGSIVTRWGDQYEVIEIDAVNQQAVLERVDDISSI